MSLDAMLQENEQNKINYAKMEEKVEERKAWRQCERTCPWAEHSMNE